MSRLTIDTGTAGNPATGDSLRGAFTKVNTNFEEIYNELGASGILSDLNFKDNIISTDNTNQNLILSPNGTGQVIIGGFGFSGNILSTTDSNADIELDPAGTGNLVLKSGNFLPQTDDTQDLGSASKRWRDLYVGPGTVKVGDTSTGLQYGSAGVYSGDGGTLIMRIDPPDGAGTHYVAFDESVREIDMSQAEVRVRDILPPQDAYGNTQTDISVGSMRVRDEYDFSTASPLLLTPENTNQDLALSPNGTGRVEIQSRDTVLGHSGADTYVRLTTKLNKDLVLDTQSGSNSGTITIPSGENSDISIEPNGTGEVTVTTNSNEFIFKSDGSFEFPDSTTQQTAASIIIVGDDSTGTTFNAGETIRIAGAGGVTTAVSGDTLTITGTAGGGGSITFVGDDSTGTAVSTGETIKIAGTQNITTAVSGDTLTITGPDLSSYQTGATAVIRAQRTAGGSSNDTGLWTFTTISGSATAVAQVITSSLYHVFTLTGFTGIPSFVSSMEVLYSPAAPSDVTNNFLSNIRDYNNPNCFTTFTPNTHKIDIQVATTQAVDYYYYIRQ